MPAITEKEAKGSVAILYRDIRLTLGVPVVNLIWRHLATIPGALEWCWASLKPVYESNAVVSEASFVRSSVFSNCDEKFPSFCLRAVGLSGTDVNSIQFVLNSYHRSNALNLVALSSLLAKLKDSGQLNSRGKLCDPTVDYDLIISGSPVVGRMPPLIPVQDMSPDVLELVQSINRIGKRDTILPSMYRHLANWPSFLALVYLVLLDLEKNGTLDRNINLGLDLARTAGNRISNIIPDDIPAMTDESLERSKFAMERFINGPIGKMTAIVPLIINYMDAK